MRKRTRWLLSLGVLALGSWFLYRENNIIDVSQVTVASSRLPEAFNGYRVVQVADLHGKAFGNEQQRLLKKINQAEPDLIVMTGDLIDSRRNGEEAALTLMKALVDRYPVYFVTGNHEVRLNLTILPKLEQLGVTVLRNESRVIEYQGQSFSLLGIDDPTTTRWREGLSEPDGIRQSLDQALQDVSPDAFQLLLAHRPEYKSLYAERSVDLVL
ncbi:metallophosphoesterase, partial [Exiguobacterium sp. UBA1053]